MSTQQLPPDLSESVSVLTFEQYAASKGASRLGIGDAGLHRTAERISPTTHRRHVLAQARRDQELICRRAELAREYEQCVASGRVRPPTAKEEVIARANGHPDNESVQAARRVAERRGWDWRSAAQASA